MGYIDVMYSIKTVYSFEQFLVSLTNFTKRGIYIVNGIEVEGLSADELSTYMSLFKSIEPKMISFILSSLKRMNVGDIEANFMSFIYSGVSDGNDKQEPTIIKPISNAENERKFRNSNLEKIETAKQSKGTQSLSGEMKSVGFEDLSNYFDLEKVSN